MTEAPGDNGSICPDGSSNALQRDPHNGKSKNGNGHNGSTGHGAAAPEALKPRAVRPSGPPVTLITGGAGFIGTNLADRLLSSGHRVLIYDNLSRAGVQRNAHWLQARYGGALELIVGDTRDAAALRQAVARCQQVFHLAAQVAVTTSVEDPIEDFEINARGTLNLLEAIRAQKTPPPLVFTSTNKVYGELNDIGVDARVSRYEPSREAIRRHGICEARPLDFHSPYGCSKGTADQYILDYARVYGLPTIVFRMSCIYGPHQFGTEDQGWVAHFLIRAMAHQAIKIYGDGRQVRDVLFADDLVDAFLAAQANMGRLAGQVFNIGGGPGNTISLLELMALMDEVMGEPPMREFGPWRPGDQKYYVTDTRKFQQATGWRARVGVREGIERLWQWLAGERRGSMIKTKPRKHLAPWSGSLAANASTRKSLAQAPLARTDD